jgi:hypothetical protein
MNVTTTTIHDDPEAATRLRQHPDPEATSYHEAGHALVAVRYNLKLRSVDVVWTPNRFGATDVDHEHAPIETKALFLLAAGAAERKHTGRIRAHDAGDLEALRPLFAGSALDPDRPHPGRSSPDVDAERQRIVDAWRSKAEQFVEREWGWIENVAKALQRRERLTGAEVKILCSHPVVHIENTTTTPSVDLPDQTAYLRARERMRSAPLDLTPADFEALARVDPTLVDQAQSLRTIAAADRVRMDATRSPTGDRHVSHTRTDYKSRIEALDQKLGRTVTLTDLDAAGNKAEHALTELTEDDLTVLGYFHGAKHVAAIRARRDLALQPPRPPAAPVETKTAAPRHVVEFPDLAADVFEDPIALQQWSDTHAMKAVPIALWHTFVAANREKRDALEQKVAALEQKVAALEQEINAAVAPLKKRIAELEASHASLEAKALKGGLPWARGTSYAVHDTVQHDGSLWRCVGSHVSTESFSHEHFLLQIKRGRDGKDAR